MALAELPRRRPLWQRLFFSVPVLGWIARDLSEDVEGNLWAAIVTLVSLWGCAIVMFGLPGLYIPALTLVPIVWLLLLMISAG